MAQYQEAFTGKLDWAMPFQRSGGFPLDRSSMFESYADALAYARQDLTDKRKLGATSYVGQLVVVYGNDAGKEQEDGTIKYTQEVAGYIITAVGQSASLMKLAQTTSTGDFGKDITALNTAVGALDTRIKALEDKPEVVDTNTQYTFATATTTEGAILVTNLDDKTTQEVQVNGWATLKALATGRTQAYVYQNKNADDYITDISTKNKYKKGDVIYFIDKNIPDEWVVGTLDVLTEGSYYTFSELEVEHPDLTQYLTITQAQNTYATITEVNKKATITDLNSLQTTVTENKTASDTKFGEVDTAIQGLQTKIDNIDVSAQIETAITGLDVDAVGGAGQYIKQIKEVDGKIEAVAEAMPDIEGIAQGKATAAANTALADAKSYVETRLGDIAEDSDVKTYVDNAITDASSAHTELAGRVKVLEDAKYGDKISALETSVGNNTTEIGTIKTNLNTTDSIAKDAQGRVANLEGTVSTHTQQITTLQTEVSSRVKEIQIGGVKQTMTAEGVVNITAVSTDLLTQGSNTLVLDCLNASLTDLA